MRQKKKILFVIESLTLAGSEKSLIALLSNLDPDLYDIDLQLFRYGGELEKFIPAYVNFLPPLDYTEYATQSWQNNIKELFTKNNISFFAAKLKYSIGLRLVGGNHSEKASLYWKAVKNAYSIFPKKYEVAIAYAQGLPTFYVIDKITSAKKVTWVNANMQFTNSNIDFQESFYNQYDTIVPVTEGNKEHLVKVFPHLSEKYYVVEDIIDYNYIKEMSTVFQVPMRTDIFNILTVSRLDNGMKGMDITVEVCKVLRDRKLNFHWYFLGKGPFKEEMELYINEHTLNNNVSILGTTDNPYPYYNVANLYVQTSRSESYGMSIAEARLLNLPIVTTRFDTVFGQMVDGKNGIVTDMNAEAVADAIERMMNDEELYQSIKSYLKQEPKENMESVKKFDGLIDQSLKTEP